MFKRVRTTYPFNSMMSGSWRTWCAACGAALLTLAAIVLAPVLLAHQREFPASLIYRSFSYVCHQIPARSFQFAGHQLPVCARCLGLYAGFFVGALIYPIVSSLSTKTPAMPARRWLLLALVPTVVDFGLDFLGWWENTHASRVSTGLLLGAALSFYVLPGLSLLFRQGR